MKAIFAVAIYLVLIAITCALWRIGDKIDEK